MGEMQISGSFVGASIARLWRLPMRLIFRDGCAGGIYAAPTDDPLYCYNRKAAGGVKTPPHITTRKVLDIYLPLPRADFYCPSTRKKGFFDKPAPRPYGRGVLYICRPAQLRSASG